MATAAANGRIRRNFINGEWVASRSTRTVQRRNTANVEEVVSVVPLSTDEESSEEWPGWRKTATS